MTRDEIRAKFHRMVRENPRASSDRYRFIASWKDWFQSSDEENSAREFLESLLERDVVKRLVDGAKDDPGVLLPSLFAQCRAAQLGKDPVWVCWAFLTWAQALRVIAPDEAEAFEARLLRRGKAAAAGASGESSTVSVTIQPPSPPPVPAASATASPTVKMAAKPRVPWGWAIGLGAIVGMGAYGVSTGELSQAKNLSIGGPEVCRGWVSACPPAPVAGSGERYTLLLDYRGARSGARVDIGFSRAGQSPRRIGVALEGSAGKLPLHVTAGPGEYRLSLVHEGVEIFARTLHLEPSATAAASEEAR